LENRQLRLWTKNDRTHQRQRNRLTPPGYPLTEWRRVRLSHLPTPRTPSAGTALTCTLFGA
jgi:hypothetical protein